MNPSALQIELHSRAGDRALTAGDLPLSIGGEGAGIAAAGLERGITAANLGVDEHGLYIEPLIKDARLNAQPLTERTRLAHGDVFGAGDALVFFMLDGARARVHVEEAQQQLTAPPVLEDEHSTADSEEEAATQSIQRAAFQPLLRAGGKGVKPRRPWRWAVAAGIAVLVAVLGLLMTSTPVHVVAVPSDAEVDFEGAWFEIALGDQYLLRPGAYTLVAVREGYETARQPTQVTKGADQQVNVTLRKLPGQIRIDTGGVAATLSVDGVPVGAVPGEYRIEAGKHEFKLTAPRYADLVQAVEITGGGAEQQLSFALVPGFSPVTIESTPAGARVTVDGKELGVTPLTTEVDAGAHTLALDAAGFRRWETTVQVLANQPQTIGPVELGLPDGRLIVRTDPLNAQVTVSGRFRGDSPLEISLAPGIEYTVEISRAGYEPARRSAAIKAGDRTSLNVALTPVLGDVTVRGEPADAQLFVDGKARGAANQTLKLPSTASKVEIRREGFVTYTTTVEPQPGVARLVEYRLLTPAQARAARVPAVIRTSLGGELRLMPTGSYEMGSERREAGARSNESRRQVTLQRAFYLSTREVTNAEYRKFKADHLSGVIKNRSLDQDSHPVVNVGWREAAEFCNWLSTQDNLPPAYEQKGDFLRLASPVPTGYRLPTEAEWEWGARHQPGRPELRVYPWGQGLPIPRNSGNYADKASQLVLASGLQGYEDGFVTTAPVGRFAPNALGLYDMDGNVSEWVNDFYTVYREVEAGPATDPIGPETGDRFVIRGGNWRTTDVTDLRLAWREHFANRDQHIGFRIARYAE